MPKKDLICFSHLRWDHVFQRPNHLMTLCSRERRVFFFEEPTSARAASKASVRAVSPNLCVARATLEPGDDPTSAQSEALAELCRSSGIAAPILWFYTPMALEFARDLPGALTIYDCMDELSGFHGAPPGLRALEDELFARADLVFTGGRSLFEAKRTRHSNVHLFPSSVDAAHFAKARRSPPVPPDQALVPPPRIGFFGVIDERMDLELVRRVASARPEWQLVFVGPVVKIDPATLPHAPNIHYLGPKSYGELPSYLSGWGVAMMPFALDESTRFISPTKTLEYLAGGKPVVSTPVADVVSPYGELGLVRIAADPEAFVQAIEASLGEGGLGPRLGDVDEFIAERSWDKTWSAMSALIDQAMLGVERAAARPSGRVAAAAVGRE